MKLIRFNNSREPGMPDCYINANYFSPSLPNLSFLSPPPSKNYSGNFIKCKYNKKKKNTMATPFQHIENTLGQFTADADLTKIL